ncbi:hypothetical protein JB92DRAFT_3125785 [Gautieria morchelliformis]|nr:hypothetical protein JB92DRAFT_3125785 [Gautieria morchelliformis]
MPSYSLSTVATIIKVTQGEFKSARRLVEADKKKATNLGLHNKASALKPDLNSFTSSTLT